MVVSGILLFLTPRGRVANWTDWTMLGLDKHQWGAVHIMNSILFVIIAGLHLYLNWSMFLGYLKKRTVAGLRMKRELAVATAVAVLFVAGTIADVPPFSSIMELNDEIKDYWEGWAAEAPVPHAEELTLVEFSGHINLSLDELTEALQEEGFMVGNNELTVGEVGRQKGVSPNDVLAAIQKHHPDAGAAGDGRGFGGGRGQGFGRVRESGKCDEDETSEHSSSEGSGKLEGRAIVEKGEPITVEGTLKQYGDEWQLVSESGIHDIHLGPEEYRESQGIKLEEGMKATVTGFSIDEEIAVCSMSISGKTYVFRNEDGRPAWAGSSRGRNRR